MLIRGNNKVWIQVVHTREIPYEQKVGGRLLWRPFVYTLYTGKYNKQPVVANTLYTVFINHFLCHCLWKFLYIVNPMHQLLDNARLYMSTSYLSSSVATQFEEPSLSLCVQQLLSLPLPLLLTLGLHSNILFLLLPSLLATWRIHFAFLLYSIVFVSCTCLPLFPRCMSISVLSRFLLLMLDICYSKECR